MWTSAELKAQEKTLAAKLDAQKLAFEKLADYGNHYVQIAHREADGEAELHDNMVDIFFVQSGEATLLVGGKMSGATRVTGPGETRGPSNADGTKKPLRAGDVVHIPALTPHQLLVAKGKQFTYFVVKVPAK
jgi:mannose-6-phosphate isomerase-like protein (cupin superfamily)